MSKIGSYKICQICLAPIYKGGLTIHNKQGLGFKKQGRCVHRCCFNSKIKGRAIITKVKGQLVYNLW